MIRQVLGVLFIGLLSFTSQADQLRVAVASNFAHTLQQLAPTFKAATGHVLVISSASTGQLYAQIKQQAPFDVFMSADTERPQLLLDEGLAENLQIYAQGVLVLLSNQIIAENCPAILESSHLKYLAIANPDLAPYGLAAKQFLQQQQLWEQLSPHLVMGENVAQAMQMVVSKNATAGLVSQSLLVNYYKEKDTCVWPLPTGSYQPINQAMVRIKHATKQALYQEFLVFLQSPKAQKIIKANGYQLGFQP